MTKEDRALLDRLANAQEQANLAQVKTSTNLDNLSKDVAKLSRSLPTVIELSVKVDAMQRQLDNQKTDLDTKFSRIWKVFIGTVGVLALAVFNALWQGAK